MRKISYALLIIGLVFIWACGSSDNSTEQNSSVKQRVQKQATAETENKKEAAQPPVTVTRQDLEQKLKDLGVPIYENAVFDRIKKTRNGGYSIRYLLPVKSKESEKKANEFYSQLMDKIAAEKGWKRTNAGNLMMFIDAHHQLVFSCGNAVTLKGDKHFLEFDFGNMG